MGRVFDDTLIIGRITLVRPWSTQSLATKIWGSLSFWSFINHSVTSPMFKSPFRFFWFENFSMGITPPIFPHYLLPAMFKFKNSFFFCFRSPSESNNSFRKKGFGFHTFWNWIMPKKYCILPLSGIRWRLPSGHRQEYGIWQTVQNLNFRHFLVWHWKHHRLETWFELGNQKCILETFIGYWKHNLDVGNTRIRLETKSAFWKHIFSLETKIYRKNCIRDIPNAVFRM